MDAPPAEMADSGESAAPALHPSRAIQGSTPPRPPKRCGLGIDFPDDADRQTHTMLDEGLRLSMPRDSKKVALPTAVPVPDSPGTSAFAALQCSAPPVSQPKAASFNDKDHALRPVRVLMPTVCDCGAPIVGCWYRKKAHWCEWFRHCRYEPLVSQFILQRSKSGRQSRSQPAFTPPPRTTGSTSSESDDGLRPPLWSAESIRETNEGWNFDEMGPPCSPREVLGPDPLSVLCLTQFLKHKLAVQTAYCGDVTSISSCSVDQLKTHVDCRNAKSYVHFRWYSSSIIHELRQQIGSPSDFHQGPSAIGCINIQHWNKKQPKTTDSLPRSSKELVQLDLEIEKVVSTFQVVHPEQDTVHVETLRRPDRSRILTWKGVDDMIWSTSSKLGLLPPDVIKQQRSVPFPPDLARSDQSWTACACKSDRVVAPRSAAAPVSSLASKGNGGFVHVTALPELLRPAVEVMRDWASHSTHLCGYHVVQTPPVEAQLAHQAPAHAAPANESENPARIIPSSAGPVSAAAASTSNAFDGTHPFELHPSVPASIQCFHVSIDSGASAPALEIESIFQAHRAAAHNPCQAVGLYLSIGSQPCDQTVLVTHCINAIQTNLLSVFNESARQPGSSALPRVFVAFCIQGTFSWRDCDARLSILRNRLATPASSL